MVALLDTAGRVDLDLSAFESIPAGDRFLLLRIGGRWSLAEGVPVPEPRLIVQHGSKRERFDALPGAAGDYSADWWAGFAVPVTSEHKVHYWLEAGDEARYPLPAPVPRELLDGQRPQIVVRGGRTDLLVAAGLMAPALIPLSAPPQAGARHPLPVEPPQAAPPPAAPPAPPPPAPAPPPPPRAGGAGRPRAAPPPPAPPPPRGPRGAPARPPGGRRPRRRRRCRSSRRSRRRPRRRPRRRSPRPSSRRPRRSPRPRSTRPRSPSRSLPPPSTPASTPRRTSPTRRARCSPASRSRPSSCRSTRPPPPSTACRGRSSRRSTRSRPTTAATSPTRAPGRRAGCSSCRRRGGATASTPTS